MWRAWTAECVERTLRTPEFPFWGRGAHRKRHAALNDSSDTPPLRDTELLVRPRPFSVFQLVGAGAVGPASLRGMETLCALSEAGACVWPFDDDDGGAGAVVVEIWPRLFAPSVRKSEAEARVAHVRAISACDAPVPTEDMLACVRQSDDAFDALVSALAMWRARSQLASLGTAVNDAARLEGRIWTPHK
jgi:hypothetical protein